MYGGTVAENGPTTDVLARPRHPYTAGLLAAVPRLSSPSGTRLTGIPGAPPDLSLPLTGCAFAQRCAAADERCRTEAPPLVDGVACWHQDEQPVAVAPPAEHTGRIGPATAEGAVPLLEAAALRKSSGGAATPRSSPSTTSPSPCTRAKPSASSESPGPANPPWPGCSPTPTRPTVVRSGSAART